MPPNHGHQQKQDGSPKAAAEEREELLRSTEYMLRQREADLEGGH